MPVNRSSLMKAENFGIGVTLKITTVVLEICDNLAMCFTCRCSRIHHFTFLSTAVGVNQISDKARLSITMLKVYLTECRAMGEPQRNPVASTLSLLLIGNRLRFTSVSFLFLFMRPKLSVKDDTDA